MVSVGIAGELVVMSLAELVETFWNWCFELGILGTTVCKEGLEVSVKLAALVFGSEPGTRSRSVSAGRIRQAVSTAAMSANMAAITTKRNGHFSGRDL
jgi:hypothetical protein